MAGDQSESLSVDTLICRRFLLQDENGKTLAMMSPTGPDGPTLLLSHPDTNTTVQVQAGREHISIFLETGRDKAGIQLQLTPDVCQLICCNAQGQPVKGITVDCADSWGITVNDSKGETLWSSDADDSNT